MKGGNRVVEVHDSMVARQFFTGTSGTWRRCDNVTWRA